MPDTLSGVIERITFHNLDNGYCVLRVQAKGHRDLVTVVGHLSQAVSGEFVQATGEWVTDKQFGQQFKAADLRTTPPHTTEGIAKYLGSGLVKGIGPRYAAKIVEVFGDRTLEVIEKHTSMLSQVKGLGAKRIELIREGWKQNRAVHQIMAFLQSFGIGTARAVRIYKTYGENAIEQVRTNPYRLATDIWGVGFKTADDLALKLGIPRDSPKRAQAAVRHVLGEASSQGHVGLPEPVVIEQTTILTQISSEIVTNAIEELRLGDEIVRDTASLVPLSPGGEGVGVRGNSSSPPLVEGRSPRSGGRGETQSESQTPLPVAAQPTSPQRGEVFRSPTAAGKNQNAPTPDSPSPLLPREGGTDDSLLYLKPLFLAELGVSRSVKSLAAGGHPLPEMDVEKAVAWVEGKMGIEFAERQRQAVRQAATQKLLVLTGGPGTGKTTIVRAIIEIFAAKQQRVGLCAPTGRAAKRLCESTGREAKTIHRLLEFDAGIGTFKRSKENPLDLDLLVVDEVSMLDVVLANQLLRAVPPWACVVLVGDRDQLPSVGAGSVLADLIDSEVVPVVRLTEVHRQASSSYIVRAAHAVNRGDVPESAPNASGDFFFVEADTPDAITAKILTMITERIPARFGLDPIRDVQILSPMNRTDLGVANMNQVLQAALNPAGRGAKEVEKYGITFRVGDKVIQTQNNYQREVFNGDIGRIVIVDDGEQVLTAEFDGRAVEYEFADLDELQLAYAITIHKSQGSEYPAVIIPVHTQHWVMLQRNLIYTGLTRGRKLVALVGTRKALEIAVGKADQSRRFSLLRWRLQQGNG